MIIRHPLRCHVEHEQFRSLQTGNVCMLMQQDTIDVFVMTDTRHSAVTMTLYVRLLRDKFGAGTAVYGLVDAKRCPGDPGGIITVIGPRWGPSYVRELSKTDFSGHGVLTAVILDTVDGRLCVLDIDPRGCFSPRLGGTKVLGFV